MGGGQPASDDFPLLHLDTDRITHRNIGSFPVEKRGILYPDKRGVLPYHLTFDITYTMGIRLRTKKEA